MRAGTIWIAAATVAALLWQAGAADAQRRRRNEPDPQAAAREAARVAYARGQQLFAAGSFAEAEAAFMEAYTAIPNPVVLLGVAEARERQGNVAGTVETLERYLAERADAPDRAAITERVTRLRQSPAILAVASTPPGARILVDGAPQPSVTPADVSVAPGSHAIRLELDGHEPHEQTVEVTFAARQEVTATLAAAAPPPPSEDDIFGGGDDTPPPPVETDEPEGPGAAVWIGAGLAGAGLIGGTVLGFLALSEQSDFDEAATEDGADRGERLALFADVAFGVAAVSAITAIVLYVTGSSDDEGSAEEGAASVRVSPFATADGAGVAAAGSF